MSKPIRETVMVVVPVKIKYDEGRRKNAVRAAIDTCRGGAVYSGYYSAIACKAKLLKTTK